MTAAGAIAELERRFGIPGIAAIVAGNGALPKVHITSPQSTGDVYLHGAQVTSWKPITGQEVLFLSSKSRWEDGVAIRGGVPICFPWFRAKSDNPKAPTHGVVRTRAWRLESIVRADDVVTVRMFTGSDETTRRWWPGDFRIVHQASFSAELALELIVTNTGNTPLLFEEALHSYYRVGEIEAARVRGLDSVHYLDNTDANREKTQHGDVEIAAQTDSAYLNTSSDVELYDPTLSRRIRLRKDGSLSTVIWNPWRDGGRLLSDLVEDEWRQMLCVEASNVLACAVELAPGQQHTMKAIISVVPFH
jgi:glucose-6-phosphate 1-epimerase